MLPPGRPWGPLQASALLVSPVLPIPCCFPGVCLHGEQECNTLGGLLYYLALHLRICICRDCKNAADVAAGLVCCFCM